MRLKFVLGAVLVLVLHAVCSQGQFEPSNNNNLDVVANSVTNLAQKISRAIASSKSKTEIFSPVSIAGALSLLLLGSSGVTRDELTKLMGFDSQPINFAEIHKSFGKLFRELVSPEPSLYTPVSWRQNDKCNNYDYEDDEPSPPPKTNQRGKRDTRTHQISVANGVFVDQNFQLGARYERLTKCLYQGSAQRLPFFVDPRQTAQRINGWAQQSTNGKIREIVTPDQVQRAPMVLASALYFKGKWDTMFVEPDTRPRPFYVNDRNRPVNVTSMATSGCFPYIDVKNWDAKIVGLPYQEGLSTMYLVVPNNSHRQKLLSLMNDNRFNLGELNNYIDKMEVKTGAVVMPKMQLENNLELKQVLSTMGLSTLFDPYKSNLSAIITTINDQDGDIEKACIHDSNPGVTIRNETLTTTSRPTSVFRGDNVNTAEQNRPVLTTIQQPYSTIIPVTTMQDCFFLKNCRYDNNQCICTIDSIDAEYQSNCPRRPFYVSQSCSNTAFSTGGLFVCKSDQFDLSTQKNKTMCYANGCTFFYNLCFCCKNARFKTTTSPPFQIQYSQSPTPQQQHQQNLQIASRIEIDNPDENQQQPPSNAPNLNNNYYPSTETVGQQQGQHAQHNINQQPPVQQYLVNTNNFQTANPTVLQTQPYPDQRQDLYQSQPNHQHFTHPQPQFSVAKSYNPNYSPNPTSPVSCYYEPECDWLHQCRYVRRCRPIPYHEPRRPKRQANRSPLFVGDIVHKVSLDIDESGTEGGAVTAVVIDRISSSFTLRLDGPFLIYLRHDNTGLPLFYGPVYDPRD